MQTRADASLIDIRGNEQTSLPLGCSVGAMSVSLEQELSAQLTALDNRSPYHRGHL